MFATLALSASAKDVIMLSDGRTIDAKVLSIGQSDISYKRADNPNGPTYTIPTSSVFYITYENGNKEVINDLSKPSSSAASQQTSSAASLKQYNEQAMRKEEERIEKMGKNNLRFRLGIGGQFGSWDPGDGAKSVSFGGGSVPELDVMWLHSIFDYTGNFGVGFGINNLMGSVEDIDITATYFTIPIQMQHVAKNGFTYAAILTPAILAGASGSYKDYDLDDDAFAGFRFGIGIEIGYNYRRWDFGLRGTYWIGNVISGLSSSTDYNIGLSVGYRLKLN